MVIFFRIFCLSVVAIFDLVNDVETIHGLRYLLTASGNLFLSIMMWWPGNCK